MRLGVHGRREQVPHSVSGPDEEQRQSRQERQKPRNSPGVGAAEEDVPQPMKGGVLQEEFPGFSDRTGFRLRSTRLAHFRGSLVRAVNAQRAQTPLLRTEEAVRDFEGRRE